MAENKIKTGRTSHADNVAPRYSLDGTDKQRLPWPIFAAVSWCLRLFRRTCSVVSSTTRQDMAISSVSTCFIGQIRSDLKEDTAYFRGLHLCQEASCVKSPMAPPGGQSPNYSRGGPALHWNIREQFLSTCYKRGVRFCFRLNFK